MFDLAPLLLHSVRIAGLFRISVVILLPGAGALLPAALAEAAPLRTFYVDPAGNDSATGAITAPWRTLA